jgi:thiamine-monophosphate kinase
VHNVTAPTAGAPAPALLRDLGEDDILARILPLLGSAPGTDDDLVGPGDDAAVVAAPARLVVTTDSMVRGRDWRDDWSSAADVAHKLGAQNVSDIAAMGGVANAALMSLTADPRTALDWVEAFAAGLGRWCAEAGVSVVGGDLSSAPDGVLLVSMTMWGDLQGRAPVLRSGAEPGDVLAVCGSLGRSSAGLAAYATAGSVQEADPNGPPPTGGSGLTAGWREYHRRPRPPWEAGPEAADAGATAMIDLSDGLVRDLSRVAAASGVSIDLHGAALRHVAVDELEAVLPTDEAWRHVLGGGEEHSLLASFPSGAALPQSSRRPWRAIGSVVAGEGVTLDGEPLEVVGWDHFRVG